MWAKALLNGAFLFTVVGIGAGAIGGVFGVVNNEQFSLRKRWALSIVVIIGALVGIGADASNRYDAVISQRDASAENTGLKNQLTGLHADNADLKQENKNLTKLAGANLDAAKDLVGQSKHLNGLTEQVLGTALSTSVETHGVDIATRGIAAKTQIIAQSATVLQGQAASSLLGIDRLLARAHVRVFYRITLNPTEPFEAEFEVANDSDVDLKSVSVTCALDLVSDVRGNTILNSTVSRVPLFDLDAGQPYDLQPCGLFASSGLIATATIRIAVSYSTTKGRQKPQIFRFSTARAWPGILVWLQSPGK